jgi:hypothetical protein
MNEEMNFAGLTDLPERAAQDCDRCRCGSFARVASGLCVSCLLRSGLDSNEANIEDFETLLAAVDIPDRDWQLVATYLEEIGRGGMGVIYRARHGPSRRVVALKRVLNYHSDSRETLTRFQREATARAMDPRRFECTSGCMSSLNGRRPRLFFDPNVNLAAEPQSCGRPRWLLQIHEPLPPPGQDFSGDLVGATAEID